MLWQQMINKIPRISMILGIVFCLLSAMYFIYVISVKQTVAKIEASGTKAITIASVVTLTAGEVVKADDKCVIIRYYNEWDGADYQKIISHANACVDYSVNDKIPIVYCVGMGAGSCLVPGLYQKYMLILSAIAFIILVFGLTINLKRKEKDKWQEEKL